MRKPTTPRQKAIQRALRDLLPLVTLSDFAPIFESACGKHLRDVAPAGCAFLATVSYIRHTYTDYDELRDDGYDHDSARFFVAEDINEQLTLWGSQRQLDLSADADIDESNLPSTAEKA